MSFKDAAQSDLWIFGYGSLMWDGWEGRFGCTRRVVADLPGYRRVFNKASVERWGSKAIPGPTLNLVAGQAATCGGIVFQFPEAKGKDVRAYLKKREGPGFPLRDCKVYISPEEAVDAYVPLYEGANVLRVTSVDEIAEMVCRAVGSGGRCIDYVRGIAAKLEELQIHDPAVTDLLAAVERRAHAL